MKDAIQFINAALNASTAFHTLEDLLRCMDNGYVPSIYPDSRRQRFLIRFLRAKGYRVFPYN